MFSKLLELYCLPLALLRDPRFSRFVFDAFTSVRAHPPGFPLPSCPSGLCEAIILDCALSLIFAGMKSIVGIFMKKDFANELINC